MYAEKNLVYQGLILPTLRGLPTHFDLWIYFDDFPSKKREKEPLCRKTGKTASL